jgi:N-sulfoglucosamine sulfohydrolase
VSDHKRGYAVHDDVPALSNTLRKAGYYAVCFAKVAHHRPAAHFEWDLALDHWPWEVFEHATNAELFYGKTREAITNAKRQGKPIYLVANACDPHRPFAESEAEKQEVARGRYRTLPRKPSRIYRPDEVPVPGYLPDLPDIRTEVAGYYSGARRADDCVGAVLKALEEHGIANDTVVFFLSDNGAPFPFAKENCYQISTKTPLIVRWPGKVRPGRVERTHYIRAVDVPSTILDILGLQNLPGSDGMTFLPVLQGRHQAGRESAVSVFHFTPGKEQMEMRAIHRGEFGYVFNLFAAEGTVYSPGDPFSGLTFKAIQRASKTDPAVARRVKFLLQRTPEELYDYSKDPNALHNLITDPAHAGSLSAFRQELLAWMRSKNDPIMAAYERYLAK